MIPQATLAPGDAVISIDFKALSVVAALALTTLGLCAWWAKNYLSAHATNVFDRKLANHSHELQQARDRSSHQFQRQLEDFTLFAARRDAAYSRIFATLHHAYAEMVRIEDARGVDPESLIDEAGRAYRRFRNTWYRRSLYLSADLTKELDASLNLLAEAFVHIRNSVGNDAPPWPGEWRKPLFRQLEVVRLCMQHELDGGAGASTETDQRRRAELVLKRVSAHVAKGAFMGNSTHAPLGSSTIEL